MKSTRRMHVPSPSPNRSPSLTVGTTANSTHSSASGYIDWPGTQNKRGESVATQSSYDDSSSDHRSNTGAAAPVGRYAHAQQQRAGARVNIDLGSSSPSVPPQNNDDVKHMVPTKEALATRNQLSPPSFTPVGNAKNVRGFPGFFNKIREVPNLMDQLDSDSMGTSSHVSSSIASSSYKNNYGRANATNRGNRQRAVKQSNAQPYYSSLPSPYAILKEEEEVEADEEERDGEPQQPQNNSQENNNSLNVIMVNGMPSIQANPHEFYYQQQPYSDVGTNSEIEPTSDYSESGISSIYQAFLYRKQLAKRELYSVKPNQGKKLVSIFRELSNLAVLHSQHDNEKYNLAQDSKQAFALVEMRSRIMERDLERGLERRGGTVVVDDLVLTPFYQSQHRVRDAVILAKAWRDGATPANVVTAYELNRPKGQQYCIPRAFNANRTFQNHNRIGNMEPVKWMDDTDFMRLKCPSLGPRCMRGFEMFTIGDCQSILLKLTNERCMQLRESLNEATAIQIESEDLLKEEEAQGGSGASNGTLTVGEIRYLESMENVKRISKQLVISERAFHFVRERVEKLVDRYETLLTAMGNESTAGGAAPSEITTASSCYTDYTDYTNDERELLERRAKRAEVIAQLAAREAILAKQQVQQIKHEKQGEIEALQKQLFELKSESSYGQNEIKGSAVMAKVIASTNWKRSSSLGKESITEQSPTSKNFNKASVDDVKQKFRLGAAERINSGILHGNKNSANARPAFTPTTTPQTTPLNDRSRLTGEMSLYLDFYRRSLEAVQPQQRPYDEEQYA